MAMCTLVLGAAWLFFALAKAVSEDSPVFALGETLGAPVAHVLTVSVIVTEGLLGLCLLFAPRRVRRHALVVSASLLLVFGAFVVLADPRECWCAGHLVALDAVTHAAVTVALLVLTGFAWREHQAPAGRLDHRLSLAGLGVVLLLLLVLNPSGDTVDDQNRQGPMSSSLVTPLGHSEPELKSAGVGKPAKGEREPSNSTPDASAVEVEVHVFAQSEPDLPLPGSVWVHSLGAGGEKSDLLNRADQGAGEHAKLDIDRGRLAPGETLWISAWSQGYEPNALQIVWTGQDKLSIDVPLRSGGAIAGLAVDQYGRPVPEATVEAWGRLGRDFSYSPEHLAPRDLPQFGRTQTREDGTYRLSGLGDGKYQLRVRPPGYARMILTGATAQVGDANANISVGLLTGIRVRVLDAVTGEPVQLAVTAFGLKGDIDYVGYHPQDTLADFLKRPLPSGVGQVGLQPVRSLTGELVVTASASAPGYKSAELEIPLTPATIVEPLDLRLQPLGQCAPVSLHATWANGTPFTGGLRVSVKSEINGRERPIRIPVWFRDGRSVEALLLPEGRSKLRLLGGLGLGRFLAGKSFSASESYDSNSASEKVVHFVLRGGRVRLHALTEAGSAPVGQYRLSFTPMSAGAGVRGTISTYDLAVQASISLEGHCISLPPGKHGLTLHCAGFKPAHRVFDVGEEDSGEQVWAVALQREAGEDTPPVPK